MSGAEEPQTGSRWRLGEKLTLVAILVTCLAAVGASITALVVQRKADRSSTKLQQVQFENASGALRAAGQFTAFVYLTSLEQTKCGLNQALIKGLELQPYVPLSSLQPTVADGVAILDAKAPTYTLRDFGRLYGYLLIVYDNFDQRGIGRQPLSPVDKTRIAYAVRLVRVVERDLEQIPAMGRASVQKTASMPGCASAPPRQ